MLKVAVIILTVMLAYAAAYSLTGLVAPKVVMKSSVEAITGKTLDDAKTAGYLEALMASQRTTGIFALCTVLSGLIIVFIGFQKAQKWAWFAMLIVGGIAWIGSMINSLAIGDTMNAILQLIGTVLCVLGVLLPIKSFFGQTAEAAPQEASEEA